MKCNAIRSVWRRRPGRGGPPGAAAAVCLLVLLCAGCQGLLERLPGGEPGPTPPERPAPEPAAEPPSPEPAPEPAGRPELPAAEQAAVERLLADAERAIANDHLTYPASGSALALYDRVMILDPGNDAARRGLERIVERYLELALSAAERRRFTEAEAMLNRARLVDPEHPGIDPTDVQVRLLAGAERHVVPLDAERLRRQDPALASTLRQAGVAGRGDGCRVRIVARSDSEGRWIYQQMSDAPGDTRIRAQLDIGSPPQVEVLCFSE
ncbi:MAG TPA: hypothetical protein VF210_18245 [Pseudomonadales bacterium]